MESAINVVRDADERFVLKPWVHDGYLPLRVRPNQSNVTLTHLAEQHGLSATRRNGGDGARVRRALPLERIVDGERASEGAR